jgi:phage gpG-like protein
VSPLLDASGNVSAPTGTSLTVTLTGLAPLMDRLSRLERDLAGRIIRTAMTKAMLVVARRSALHYLTGPRPSVLGVKTNLLRGSVMPAGDSPPSSADSIWEITQSGGTTEGRLGTRVKYGPVHEEGWILHPRTRPHMVFYWEAQRRWVRTREVVMPRRPFLAPAAEDTRDDVNTVFNHEIESELNGL